MEQSYCHLEGKETFRGGNILHICEICKALSVCYCFPVMSGKCCRHHSELRLKNKERKEKTGGFEDRLHAVLVWDQDLSCLGMCRNGCISSRAALAMGWTQEVFFGVEGKALEGAYSLFYHNVGGLAAFSLVLGLNDQSCNQPPQTDTPETQGDVPIHSLHVPAALPASDVFL